LQLKREGLVVGPSASLYNKGKTMTEIGATIFQTEFSQEVWENTYKHHTDDTINDTFRRVARDIASVEETEEKKKEWEDKFYEARATSRLSPAVGF